MRSTPEGRPEVGADSTTLGVRASVATGVPTGISDVEVDADGRVCPAAGGMSVTLDDPLFLPDHRLPREMGGTGRHPVWSIVAGEFPDTLCVRIDASNERHGLVEPMLPMSVVEYRSELASTQGKWRRVR